MVLSVIKKVMSIMDLCIKERQEESTLKERKNESIIINMIGKYIFSK